jgi:DHA1 family multidrug resistance protein-like MFS transporter
MWVFTAALFADLLAWGHMVAFTPLYLRQDLGVPAEQVPIWAGVLAATPLAVAVPMSPFWGVLAERYNRKAVIVRSEYASCLGYLLAAVASGPWGLLLSRVAFGFSFGNVAVMLATQSIVTPHRRLGAALSIIQAAQPAATAASPLWGALLVQTLGLRALWAVDALFVLCSGSAILLLVREPRTVRSTAPILGRVRQVAATTVREPTVRWSFVAWFLVFAGAGSIDPFVPVLIQRLYDGAQPALAIGLILGIYGLATAAGTVAIGRFSDRASPTRVLMASCGALALVVGLIGLSPTLLALAALLLLRALPQAGTGPALYLHLARVLPPAERAPIMAFSPLPRNLAYLVAPLVAAALSGLDLRLVFLFSAGCYLLGLLVAWLLDRAPAFGPRAAAREAG